MRRSVASDGQEESMKRRYVTVDVFTDRLFQGNPLAVVLDAGGLSTSQMQAIAVEFNYSETTFVLPPQQPDHTALVRIFTPSSEVPFAGHPNVGTAFALARLMAERKETVPPQLVFEEQAGLVPVSLIRENGTVIGSELLAPEPLSRRSRVTPEQAAACLSLSREDVRLDLHGPQVFSVGLPFLVVELASRDALRRAAPNGPAYRENLPLDGARAVYAYVRAASDNPAELDVDFLSRMFTPRLSEDPATGSATGAVAAMLAEASAVPDGGVTWRFLQGVDMGRPSLLIARVCKEADAAQSVYVGGRCVNVMEGSFELAGDNTASKVATE
jgi:trans-2,3-dihydro-3-hydroxyanthranilate isomerase